jgi:NAD(P)-dependent dehydrogenase (short-subunit alcohol dehydrogenase family)
VLPVALISGASRGIGAAVAQELEARGWALSLGMRSPSGGEAASRFIHRYEARAAGGERDWVAATAARFGRIDAVVANAGILISKTVAEAEDDELETLLDVNVKAPLRLVRAAWPWLKQSGRGRVAVVVSLSGKRVKSAKAGLYAVSKFAALGLAHAIRHAGWDDGIRCTAICPGFVATDMAAAVTAQPLSTMIQPADLARIVALTLELPNTASVAEIPVNCALEEAY